MYSRLQDGNTVELSVPASQPCAADFMCPTDGMDDGRCTGHHMKCKNVGNDQDFCSQSGRGSHRFCQGAYSDGYRNKVCTGYDWDPCSSNNHCLSGDCKLHKAYKNQNCEGA